MIRKISLMMLLAVAILITGAQANRAEAYEQYVGTYSDGTSAYLLTQSVNIQSRRPYTFTCTVRYTGNYLYYSFFPVNGSPYYRNSEGYEAYVFGGESPVAANIYRYVTNNF